jgi:predicted secreted Zn-dependent protease
MTLLMGATVRTTYNVTASTLADVVAVISARREAGECTWAIGYTYDSVGRDGKPRGLVVEATITILMPVWVGRDTARAVERTEWDRSLRALSDHEDGHDTRARAAIQQLHDTLENTRASRLSSVYASEKARVQRVSDAYDTATRHGQRPPPGTTVTIPP